MTATEKDRDILARTLWGGARGEGTAGQIAVAWTIKNRVIDGKTSSWWGECYAGVCQKPWQFSCWNKTDQKYQFLIGVKQIPFRELAQCRIAADKVIDGAVPDPTGGATHNYFDGNSAPSPFGGPLGGNGGYPGAAYGAYGAGGSGGANNNFGGNGSLGVVIIEW